MKPYFTPFFYSKNFFIKANSLISVFALSSSFFFQYVMNFPICNLCLLQRFCFIAIFIVSLLSIFLKVKKLFLYILNFLFITSGIIFSLRQIYLQRFATYESMSCVPEEVFRNYIIFTGHVSCAEIYYYILGLSFAEWSLIIFLILLSLNIFYIQKKRN